MSDVNNSCAINLEDAFEDIVGNTSNDYMDEMVVLLNTDNISNVSLDRKLFKDGVDEMSVLCGKIAALCNVGITPSMALSYLADKEASMTVGDYNLQISKMNANATIESSKYSSASVQNMMV